MYARLKKDMYPGTRAIVHAPTRAIVHAPTRPTMHATTHAFASASARALASAVLLTALTVLSMSACGPALQRAPTPAPAPAAPRPEPVVPVVVAPAVSKWTLSATLPSTRYLTEISAQLERDSAGRAVAQHVETRALENLRRRVFQSPQRRRLRFLLVFLLADGRSPAFGQFGHRRIVGGSRGP